LLRSENYGFTFQAVSVTAIVHILLDMENTAEALRVAKDASMRFEEAGDWRALTVMLHSVTEIYLDADQNIEALRSAERCVEITRRMNDKAWEAKLLLTLVTTHHARREYGKAAILARESLTIFVGLKDTDNTLPALQAAVKALIEKKDFSEATRLVNNTITYFQSDGDFHAQAMAMYEHVNIQVGLKEYSKAKEYALDMQLLMKKAGLRSGQGSAFYVVSNMCLGEQDGRAALRFLKKATIALKPIGAHQALVDVQLAMANVHLMTNKLLDGIKICTEALNFLETTEYVEGKTKTHLTLANLYYIHAFDHKDSEKHKDCMQKSVAAAEAALALVKNRAGERVLYSSALFWVAHSYFGAEKPEAMDYIVKCLEVLRATDKKRCSPTAEPNSLLVKAFVHQQLKQTKEAFVVAKEALEMFTELEHEEGAAKCRNFIEKIPTDDVTVKLGPDPQIVLKGVVDIVIDTIGVSQDQLADDTPLGDVGMDSLSSIELRNSLMKKFGMNLSSSLMFDYPTAGAIADHIVFKIKSGEGEGN